MKKFALTTLLVVAMLLFAFSASVNAEINMFGTGPACISALVSGNGVPYIPQHFGLNSNDPVNGSTRVARSLETDACVRMKTTAGVRWVIQKKGDVLRWNVNANGSLGQPYARDDCGNPINEISYPSSPGSQGPQGGTPYKLQIGDRSAVQSDPEQREYRDEQRIIPPQARKVRAGVNAGFLGFWGLEASSDDSLPQLCVAGCPSAYVGGAAPVVGVAYTGGYVSTGSYAYTGGGYYGGRHHHYNRHPPQHHRYQPPRGIPPGGHTGPARLGGIPPGGNTGGGNRGGGGTGRAR